MVVYIYINMVSLRKLLLESDSSDFVFRGTLRNSPTEGLGISSTGVQNKLVATLGPNYTNNKKLSVKFSAKSNNVFLKKINGRVLDLNDYNDVIRLYQQYESQMTPGLASRIKKSSDIEQLEIIQNAGDELRNILKKKGYDWVSVSFKPSDLKMYPDITDPSVDKIYIDLNPEKSAKSLKKELTEKFKNKS
jgi:hypothetical protein